MFVSFLLPYPVRQCDAPYLWVYYKQLCSLPVDEVIYIGSEDYFLPPHHYQSQARWEVRDEYHPGLDYRIPFPSDLRESRKRLLSRDLFEPLERRYGSSIGVWRHLLTQDYAPLGDAFRELLVGIARREKIEAILTFCNCPAIQRVAQQFGIHLIHNEIGPLRAPDYRPTGYFDFRGVNGNTEAGERLARYLRASSREPVMGSMLDVLAEDPAAKQAIRRRAGEAVGIALQLPDDSNTVAFSHGFDQAALLRLAKQAFPDRVLLIRQHPQAAADMDYAEYGVVDASQSAADFIAQCEIVFTINSSVGFEALLLGRKVVALGDAFYASLAEPQAAGRQTPSEYGAALNFLAGAYLIPYAQLFDLEYYRWRLTLPSEADIMQRHLRAYAGG